VDCRDSFGRSVTQECIPLHDVRDVGVTFQPNQMFAANYAALRRFSIIRVNSRLGLKETKRANTGSARL
jgi:hypothetical protein